MSEEGRMGSAIVLVRRLLAHRHEVLDANITGLTLAEALFVPEGGYRSALGTLKHAAAWSHVYHSFAFEHQPRGWSELDWPRDLRDRVDASATYLEEIVSWLHLSQSRWMESLRGVTEAEGNLPRPLHWGQTAPLFDIVLMVAGHHLYHAGEINQLLAIYRGEAWEEGEEVEENHVSTSGHRVIPPWQRPVP
jgi:hypothetical protein